MNLYEIMFEHYSQKDSEKGIFTYLIAKSDEEVYEWIKLETELNDGRILYVCWGDYEDEKTFDIYDDDYNVIGEETFKKRMVRLKGELYDEEVELSDLYYGKTLIGWEKVKENIKQEEVDILLNSGISLEIT